MSTRAVEFVENWVSENIDEDDVDPAEMEEEAAALAARCLEEAVASGIPQSEIEDTFDDLTAFIAGEIEELHRRDELDEALAAEMKKAG